MIWFAAIMIVTIGCGIAAYDFLHGQRLVLDLWQEFRLARADLLALDRSNAGRVDKSDIIISLTTIPSRIAFVADTLKSLLQQKRPPKEIRLYVPTFSTRENRFYDIPTWLRNLKSVTIHHCNDLGPATKFIPALTSLPPDQLILAVDDDRIYPSNLIADLEAAVSRRADAAYGFSGWIAPPDLTDKPTTLFANVRERPPVPLYAQRQRQLRAVDILQGTGGYLIRPRFFSLDRLTDFSAAPPSARNVDDVWMSAHCNVPKFVIPARRSNFQPWRRLAFYKRTSLGWINRGKSNEDRNNSILLRHFASRWMICTQRQMERRNS